MAKRRTKEQQIADLQAKQALDMQRATARAGVDDLKTQLHRRDYKAARATVASIDAALAKLIEADERSTEPTEPPDDAPAAAEKPIPFGGDSAS